MRGSRGRCPARHTSRPPSSARRPTAAVTAAAAATNPVAAVGTATVVAAVTATSCHRRGVVLQTSPPSRSPSPSTVATLI